MNTTQSRRGPGRPQRRFRRQGRLLLVTVGLATALLAGACDTAQEVPWASYSSGLQPRIDAATATGNCAALQVFHTAAENTNRAHEKATGFPNDALVSYIQAAQARAGCPAGSG
jgi:outer membrane murein-binding lipoprotein Lpp